LEGQDLSIPAPKRAFIFEENGELGDSTAAGRALSLWSQRAVRVVNSSDMLRRQAPSTQSRTNAEACATGSALWPILLQLRALRASLLQNADIWTDQHTNKANVTDHQNLKYLWLLFMMY
jgi:hypothetical protein